MEPGCHARAEGFEEPSAKPGAMSETEVARVDTERSKVESWRLHVLIEAGYPVLMAERVAGSDVDLHRAVELVRCGCPAETAVEILL